MYTKQEDIDAYMHPKDKEFADDPKLVRTEIGLVLKNVTQGEYSDTKIEYSKIMKSCEDLFMKKNKDYGVSWRIMRLPSITDQIYIKANRIRTIQDTKVQKVDEDINGEFVAIINYCVMALIQIATKSMPFLNDVSAVKFYTTEAYAVQELLFAKNHDYGEAWRDMRVTSMTDIILMKLHRIKQIEDNEGFTLVSEGVKSGYQDIINYSVFCLIKLGYKI